MDDKLREVYESDPLAMASAYGVDVVDPDETVEASKSAVQFGWESLPGVGTTYTVRDITSELEKESPNYLKIGALAGAEVIGLIPGLGSAAKSMIRRGAKTKVTKDVVDVTTNVPKVPRLDTDLPPAENAALTQIAGTLPTYKKADSLLKELSGEGKTLDFGAGLGLSKKELGFDTYEPFPKEGFKPDFNNPSEIPSNSYKKITNLNVLNVVPKDVRDTIVKDIGRILEPGGRAVITTRGRDVMDAKGKPGPEEMSIITTRNTYQKGFTQPELKTYIQETLGESFDVVNNKLGAAGVTVHKLPTTGYAEGGAVMDKQMEMAFAEGGTLDLDSVPDNTQGVDPVSGNEVPLGSMPEEVRDDIPAQLSEGEYVVPADVVRYYGVKYFEDLRAKAKFGYQDMEENGRIGGEPIDGMEVIEPQDDMMFDISELEVVDDGQPMEMAAGGYALSPGDEGYDEMGALGLGIEGISSGYGGSGSTPMVEVRAYKNESGHTIYITHIDGKPQTNIPPGYSLVTSEATEEDITEEQPTPQVVTSSSDDSPPPPPIAKAINYKELTTEELADMLEEQKSPKMNLIAAAASAVNPILGLFIKGAAMASARSLENELERRINDEGTSVADKAVLEGLLKASKEEKPGLISRVFGALKDEFFPESEEEAAALEEAKKRPLEIVKLNSNLEGEYELGEVAPLGAIEPVAAGYTPTPEPVETTSPYKGITPEVVTQMENAVSAAAQARKEQQKKQQAELDARIASMSSTARVKREKEEAATRQAELARQRSANIQQVSDDSGYSIAELGRSSAPSSTVSAGDKAAKAAGATPGAGGQFGMKDGGLASKKQRKKKK